MQGGVLSVATPEKIASTLATTLIAPTNLASTAGDGRVTLAWSASANASGYRVYRDGALIGTVNAVSFVDTAVTLGVTYQYAVSAINATSESLKTAAVAGASAVTAPSGLAATPGNLMVDLAWDAVAGADSYRVFRNGTLIANVTVPTYTDSSVSNGTAYAYTVRTVVGTVSSAPSAAVTAMPDSIILSAPTNIVAAAGDRSVALSWDAVANAGNYQVLRNGTVVALPLTNSYVDSGLTNGVTYTYTLKAVSGTHSSLVSSAVTAVPSASGASALAAPTNVAAVAGDSSASVSWSAVAGATSYELRRDGVVVATTALTTVVDSGLTNGSSYSYTVTAKNASTTSAASSAVTATPNVAPPSAPTGVVAIAGDARVSLSWNAVGSATSYSVLRNGTVIGTSATTSYVDTTALNGVTYTYSIKAVNAGGTSATSSSVTATPAAVVIPVPAGLVATAGDSQVALTWTATAGATGYQVLRGGVVIATPVTNSYVDTGVTNGTAYSYTLKAVTASGTSAASAAVSATPVAAITQLAAPTGLVANTATALNTGALRLQWSAVSGATGYSVYRNGVLLGTTATNSYTPTGVTYGSINSYYVVATDAVVSHTSTPSATISVGVYQGVAATDARGREVYGQIQVFAIVSGGSITGCWATYPTTSDSGSINRSAIPTLCSQTLTKQPTSATVATLITNVSGATATSPAFRTSLQDALTQAGK
jgi:fibronectin type 3 domain-containing protein